MKYYHSLNFDLSPTAKQWVIDRYKHRFEDQVGHDTDLSLYNFESQREWRGSIVGQELRSFLSRFGASDSYYGINVFFCTHGNPAPHIDTKLDFVGNIYRIKSRLNVMVLGNVDDPLTWWDVDYDQIGLTTFKGPDGNFYPTKDVPKELPEPVLTVKNVYTPSAFVKTDCVHTVNFTPGVRLIVTVALDKTIEELLQSAGIS